MKYDYFKSMGAIIKEIKITDEKYSFKSDNEKNNVLQNLSKINIFVGENNSGKSRFLRSIVKKEDFEFLPNDDGLKLLNNNISDINLPDNDIIEKINEEISLLKEESEKLVLNYSSISNITPISTIGQKLEEIDEIFLIPGKKNHLEPLIEYKKFLNNLERQSGHTTGSFNHSSIGRDFNSKLSPLEYLGFENIKLDFEFFKLYIPILRGLRPLLESNHKDLYKERTIEDYFADNTSYIQDKDKIEIFSGLSTYNSININSRLSPRTRGLINEFKEFLRYSFFDNQKIEITASVDEEGNEKVLNIKIGDEHEKPIYDLGDGIQSIIILTFQLFLHKNENLLVFIEEPEQLLHPGLQRKLIETFLNQEGFENFQFFLTTHSNHFLDITLDFDNISIFTIRKELDDSNNNEKVPKFIIENLSEGDTSALEILGVRNSSVFLSNCTIWVEGITDRHYLRHYLEIYQKEHEDNPDFIKYEEDYHYSFVEYGGNNITHWSFLDKEEAPINVEKLCGRLFLVADKDHGKEKRHKQLEDKLGKERVHILKCKEIENLVNPEVLLKIVKDYEKIGQHEDSEYIKEDIKYSEYKNIYLGRFIEEKIILDRNKMRRNGYMARSGTIKNKDSFLKRSTKYIQTWDDLSPEAKELCEKIYNFIESQNQT